MRGNYRDSGVGKFSVVAIFILLAILLVIGVKLASNPAPTVELQSDLKGIGMSTPLKFEVRDRKYAIKRVEVIVHEEGKSFNVPVIVMAVPPPRHPWWKFWVPRPESRWSAAAQVGRRQIPDLKEGRATLEIIATNNAWGRFFRGGQSRVSKDLPVRFAPPRVEVLTGQHYINLGGCDMVVFKVSPGTTESGVEVGKYFFTSFPVKDSMPQTRLALFAFPYDVDPATTARIVARDDAGNQSVAGFTYRVFPKKFHQSTIALDDAFMNRVVPAIMSETPEIGDQGSLLKNYLELNGKLRQIDAHRLVEFSKKTAPQMLWKEPFIRLPAKTEAFFADFRTYTYNNQVVDHQVHLGFDLAGLEHMPIKASNDGAVAWEGFLGIYGNAVVIDHGCGIQTLYGHMGAIDVKAGQPVKRDQEIGRSDQTGLAAGDHLHFTVLLDGVAVNPTEWWDPHWIHDRIMAKLTAYK